MFKYGELQDDPKDEGGEDQDKLDEDEKDELKARKFEVNYSLDPLKKLLTYPKEALKQLDEAIKDVDQALKTTTQKSSKLFQDVATDAKMKLEMTNIQSRRAITSAQISTSAQVQECGAKTSAQVGKAAAITSAAYLKKPPVLPPGAPAFIATGASVIASLQATTQSSVAALGAIAAQGQAMDPQMGVVLTPVTLPPASPVKHDMHEKADKK